MALDCYETLNLTRSATATDVSRAYRKLALKFHPDRDSSEEAAVKFLDVAKAYDVLSEPKTKGVYDLHGDKGLREGISEPGKTIDPYVFSKTPDDVFQSFFGTANPYAAFAGLAETFEKHSGERQPQGAALLGDLNVSLSDLYKGSTVSIEHVRMLTSVVGEVKKQESKLSVDLSAGYLPGHLFRFDGEGNSLPGVIVGPAVYKLVVQEEGGYSVVNDILTYHCKIPLVTALTGTSVRVPCLDGRSLDLPLSSIVGNGSTKMVQGEGLLVGKGVRGPLEVTFDVTSPLALTPTQKKLIKAAFLLPEKAGAEATAAVKAFTAAFESDKAGWSRGYAK